MRRLGEAVGNVAAVIVGLCWYAFNWAIAKAKGAA
jgi:hypothetical protein